MKKPTKEQLLNDVLSDLSWSAIAEKYGYSDSRFLRKLSVRYGFPQRRKIYKPSKETLEDLIANNVTPKEIASRLGYAEGGESLIYKYCREYGIKFDLGINHEIRKLPISDAQKSIIWGTLLGDGYLNHANGPYLVITHGLKQYNYLMWLKEALSPFVSEAIYHKKSTSKLGNDDTNAIHTFTHPFFKEVEKVIYTKNKKVVNEEWLSRIDPLALAVWYMDDGSRNKRTRTITLCTNGFSYDEHLLIQNWFLAKWELPVKIEPRRNNQFSIRINASQSDKFLNIVKDFVPDCMSYKLGG